MAEKGGKGISLSKGLKGIPPSKGGKTPSKSGKIEASLKGKVTVSSIKGSRVSIGSPSTEASVKRKASLTSTKGGMVSGVSSSAKASLKGNASTLSGKSGKVPLVSSITEGAGIFTKGGKNDKTGKATDKSSSISRELCVAVLKPEEIPKNAKCLMDCEASATLQKVHEEMQTLSDDPAIKIPKLFEKGLQYAKRCIYYSNNESAKQVLETLKQKKVSDAEICLIGNICPETVNEVYSLVPSIKANKQVNEELIKQMIFDLAKLKNVK